MCQTEREGGGRGSERGGEREREREQAHMEDLKGNRSGVRRRKTKHNRMDFCTT